MRRVFNWFLLLVLVVGVLSAVSYVGARATAGKVVGNTPPLSERTITFNFKGVEDLPGRPRAWVISYERTRLPGVRRAFIYISPTGKLIATKPANLDDRLSLASDMVAMDNLMYFQLLFC